MRRCRYGHRCSKCTGRDSNPHLAVRDQVRSIVIMACCFKLERELKLQVTRCLYQLGYRDECHGGYTPVTWVTLHATPCPRQDSNLHCHAIH